MLHGIRVHDGIKVKKEGEGGKRKRNIAEHILGHFFLKSVQNDCILYDTRLRRFDTWEFNSQLGNITPN